MNKFVLVLLAMVICGVAYAETIEIPYGITKEQASEWMSILVERKVQADMNANPVIVAASEKAKTDIDTYRKAVGLKPKFEKVETPVAPAEPINTGN